MKLSYRSCSILLLSMLAICSSVFAGTEGEGNDNERQKGVAQVPEKARKKSVRAFILKKDSLGRKCRENAIESVSFPKKTGLNKAIKPYLNGFIIEDDEQWD